MKTFNDPLMKAFLKMHHMSLEDYGCGSSINVTEHTTNPTDKLLKHGDTLFDEVKQYHAKHEGQLFLGGAKLHGDPLLQTVLQYHGHLANLRVST
jgi:hypothetical protein